jgi:hypothetical protein
MDSSDENNKLVEFERLNPVGKLVFLTGTAFKAAEQVVGYTVTTLQSIWDEAEKAFSDGLSDTSQDAVILEEYPSDTKGDKNEGEGQDSEKAAQGSD